MVITAAAALVTILTFGEASKAQMAKRAISVWSRR
jgi:hypothetical protein